MWARFANCAQGYFYRRILKASDGSLTVVFANEQFVSSMSNSVVVHVDATFKVVPRHPESYQLLTVFVNKYDHVSFLTLQ